MAEEVLTASDVQKIVYNSDESLSDCSSDSVSSSDEEEILHRNFRWETMDNYTGHREVLSCDFGPRNGAENVSDIVQCFEFFLTKKSCNKLSEKL